MTLLKFEVRPNVGSPVALNTTDANGNHLYPMDHLEITTAIDVHEFKKMEEAGEWPSFAYPGAMTIHSEGHILGVGTDISVPTATQDFVTKRLALLTAILPPMTVLTARKHGVIRIRYDGMTEDADADVILTDQSIPIEALYPANSQYLLTWKGFSPWFVGVSSSTKYLLG